MRKFLALLCVTALILGTMPCAKAADESFISIEDLNIYFNYAAALTNSGNAIREDNITFTMGEVNDIYQVTLASNVGMQISAPHMDNYQGELSDANGVMLVYVPDGSSDSALKFIYGMGELAIATGAITSASEITDFLTELGFTDNIGKTDASGEIVKNGLKYSYSISSTLGYWFWINKDEK